MGPVFVLAGGGRTGSTLLQRLLLSTHQVLVWGEHEGAILYHLRRMLFRLNHYLGGGGGGELMRKQFLTDGYNSWVPNMNPEFPVFLAACKDFLDQSLAKTAQQMGYLRWGFKEIRYGKDDAVFLNQLYPDARFLFLVRNPTDCLRSIKSAMWYQLDFQENPNKFLETWATLSQQLLEISTKLPKACLLRYEDIVANPDELLKKIAEVCEIPLRLFDRGVLDSSERGTNKAPVALDETDKQALADEKVRRCADELGYEI